MPTSPPTSEGPRGPLVTTPIAIVLAGALIGLGAYLGLRTRTTAPAPATAPTAMTAEEIARLVQAQQQEQRAQVAASCRDALGGAPGRWQLTYTFAPDGSQASRGMKVEGAAPAAGRCVQQYLPSLRIPPQPAPSSVTVPFELP